MTRSKKKPEPKRKVLSIVSNAEMISDLQAEADKRGMMVSSCARQLIRERLDELKKNS